MAECIAVCVDPAKVDQVWPFVSRLIKNAYDRVGMGDFAAVELDVKEGRSLLWLAWDEVTVLAAAVTELYVTNELKVCEIIACGGQQRERWLFLIGRLEEHAREEGCDRVRIRGRGGWTKVLGEYRVCNVTLEKKIK